MTAELYRRGPAIGTGAQGREPAEAAVAAGARSLRVHRFLGLEPGLRLVVTGAVHGNERAGTEAIGGVLVDIERGELEIVRGSVSFVPVYNPNLAYQRGSRMGDRNLNRRLQPTAEPSILKFGLELVRQILCLDSPLKNWKK